MHFDFIPNCLPKGKTRIQAIRCLKSLCVSGHFDLLTKSDGNYIAINKDGIDAYNSEEFYSLELAERTKKVNNNYTIAFGAITAIGVLWTLFFSLIQANTKSKPQEMRIIIEQSAKKQPLQIDTIRLKPSKVSRK